MTIYFQNMAEARQLIESLQGQIRSKDLDLAHMRLQRDLERIHRLDALTALKGCMEQIFDLEDDLLALADALEASEQKAVAVPSPFAMKEAGVRLHACLAGPLSAVDRERLNAVVSFLYRLRQQ